MPHKYVSASAPQNVIDHDALPLERPVAVYYRQSTLKQVGNTSTKAQLLGIPEQLKRMGWKEDQIILIDADAGVSGTLKISERDGMRRLFDMVKRREIGGVAIIDEDRLFRDVTMIETDTFIEACRQSKVIVITPTVRYIFHHPFMGSFYIAQFRRKCEMAAEFLEISAKKRLGARHRIRLEGKWAGQKAYGYMADMRDKNSANYRNLVPHAPFAEAINTIFQTYVECQGNSNETERVLKERGFKLPSIADCPLPDGFRGNYRTKTHRPIPTAKTIRDLVTNVIYRGDYVYRGVVTRRHNHPAIVPDDLFTAAFNFASVYDDTGKINLDYHGQKRHGTASAQLRTIEPPLLEGRLYVLIDGEWHRARVLCREHDKKGYTYAAKRSEGKLVEWYRSCAEIDAAVRYHLQIHLAATATSEVIDKKLEDQERLGGAELKRLNARTSAEECKIENFGRNMEVLFKPDASSNTNRDFSAFSDMHSRNGRAKDEYKWILEQRATLINDPTKAITSEPHFKIMEWPHDNDLSGVDARHLVATLIERVEVTSYKRYGAIEVTIHWTDTDSTDFELSRGAAQEWKFIEIEALKYHAVSTSSVVRSAAVPCRTWAAICQQARQLGLPRGARGPRGTVRRTETFKGYCHRAHGLRISEHSICIVELGDGYSEIMVKDLNTDATIIINDRGEMTRF